MRGGSGDIWVSKGVRMKGHTFMRITRGHEKWLVNFEAPATALDGAGGG